jgi:hypothetical protein
MLRPPLAHPEPRGPGAVLRLFAWAPPRPRHYTRSVNLRALSWLGLWTIAVGCEIEALRFRTMRVAQSPDASVAPSASVGGTFELDGGRGAPPSVFNLGQARPGSPFRPSGPQRDDFVSRCDAGLCTCRGDADCPPLAPLCDLLRGACAQCFSFQDCLRDFGAARAWCEQGQCRGCGSDAECPIGWDCRQGTCVESCDVNRDCPRGWFCQDGVCASAELLPP